MLKSFIKSLLGQNTFLYNIGKEINWSYQKRKIKDQLTEYTSFELEEGFKERYEVTLKCEDNT
jgi:hypothetical protein